MEVYPSPAEGIGLENRQGSQIPRGFESLYLLHFKYDIQCLAHKYWRLIKPVADSAAGFLYVFALAEEAKK